MKIKLVINERIGVLLPTTDLMLSAILIPAIIIKEEWVLRFKYWGSEKYKINR
jgi:hypothetical protein